MLSAPVDFISRFHGIHENNTLSTWTRVEDLGYQVLPWIAKIYSVIFDSSNCSSDFNWRIRKFNAEILILVWGQEYAEKIIIQSLFPKSLGFPHQFKKIGKFPRFCVWSWFQDSSFIKIYEFLRDKIQILQWNNSIFGSSMFRLSTKSSGSWDMHGAYYMSWIVQRQIITWPDGIDVFVWVSVNKIFIIRSICFSTHTRSYMSFFSLCFNIWRD